MQQETNMPDSILDTCARACVVHTTASSLHNASNDMWQDASILSGAARVPNVAFKDAPLAEYTEEMLDREVESLYSKVNNFKLPVPDDEWYEVVKQSRHERRCLFFLLHAIRPELFIPGKN